MAAVKYCALLLLCLACVSENESEPWVKGLSFSERISSGNYADLTINSSGKLLLASFNTLERRDRPLIACYEKGQEIWRMNPDLPGRATACTSQGNNFWVCGSYQEYIAFKSLNAYTLSDNATFILKIDPNGRESLLISPKGNSLPQHITSIDNRVMIAGEFADSLNWGEGVFTQKGEAHSFLSALDSSGMHLWTRSFKGKIKNLKTNAGFCWLWLEEKQSEGTPEASSFGHKHLVNIIYRIDSESGVSDSIYVSQPKEGALLADFTFSNNTQLVELWQHSSGLPFLQTKNEEIPIDLAAGQGVWPGTVAGIQSCSRGYSLFFNSVGSNAENSTAFLYRLNNNFELTDRVEILGDRSFAIRKIQNKSDRFYASGHAKFLQSPFGMLEPSERHQLFLMQY